MSNDYQSSQTVKNYINFLNSTNGPIQRKVLSEAIIQRIPPDPALTVLDAGCGPGWLSGDLKKFFTNLYGCDSSQDFINSARVNFPKTNFLVASLESQLPYEPGSFDVVILNMVAPDLRDLEKCFTNLNTILKTSGKLIVTIPNPELSYPAAVWKRGFLDVLLMRKPKLIKQTPPPSGTKIKRDFGPYKISSHYYSLDHYLQAAQSANFKLVDKFKIRSEKDSLNFDLNYQLFRYPLFLLLEFSK